MNENTKYYVWLSGIPKVGTVTQKLLIGYYADPKVIYDLDIDELIKIKGITRKQAEFIALSKCLDEAERIIENCIAKNIDIMTIQDDLYPHRAKCDRMAPLILYTKGKVDLNRLNKSVGIVGARRCTQEDKFKTVEITEDYVDKGYAVISGMAKGVDSYGHTACIQKNGYTVAVLGNGLDICYPKEHESLMQSIEENGLLVSEYPPGVKPKRYYFPKRNRIIAEWSDEVVIIAPGKKSGSLITGDYAIELGRKVIINGYCDIN